MGNYVPPPTGGSRIDKPLVPMKDWIDDQQARMEREETIAQIIAEARAKISEQARERREAARERIAASPGVLVPEEVLEALLDVYRCDQEGMAELESYYVIEVWEADQ